MKLIFMHLDIVAEEIDVLFIPTLNAENRTSRVLIIYLEIGAMSKNLFLYDMLLPEIG